MRTIACLFLILLLVILSVCVQPAPAQSTVDQHWIDQLKKTPVNQIEAGLSSATFADWFADRVRPSEIGYEVKECQERNNPQRLLCVFAYTKPPRPGWNRWIQLNFVVSVLPSSATATTNATPLPCRFWFGWDGPSNPQMLRPTLFIRKLGDLEKRYPAPATRPNSG